MDLLLSSLPLIGVLLGMFWSIGTTICRENRVLHGFRLGLVISELRDKSRYAIESNFNPLVLERLAEHRSEDYSIYSCNHYSHELWTTVYHVYVVFNNPTHTMMFRLHGDVDFLKLRTDAEKTKQISKIPIREYMKPTYYVLREEYQQTVDSHRWMKRVGKCLSNAFIGRWLKNQENKNKP